MSHVSPELIRKEEGLFAREELSKRQIGLALSGGGIRSATFSLGVLQALAKHGLLSKLRYLSTVSGGGYAGGLLGRLFQPEKAGAPNGSAPPLQRVVEALTNPASPVVDWLRSNGRYLAPRGRGDAFFAAGIYLRNLVAIHLNVAVCLLFIFGLMNLARMFLGETFANGPAKAVFGWLFLSPYYQVLLAIVIYGLVPSFWAYWLVRRTRRDLTPTQFVPSIMTAAVAAMAWYAGEKEYPLFAGLMKHLACVAAIAVALAGVVRIWIKARHALAVFFRRDVPRMPGAPESTTDVRNALSTVTADILAIACGVFVIVLIDSLGETLYFLWSIDKARLIAGLGALIPALMALGRFSAPAMSKDKTPVQSLASIVANRGLALAGVVLALLLAVLWSAVAHGLMWSGLTPETPSVAAYVRDSAKKVQQVVVEAPKKLKQVDSAVELSGPQSDTEDASPFEIVVTPERRLVLRDSQAGDTAKHPTNTRSQRALIAIVVAALIFMLLTSRNLDFVNLSSLHQFYQARLARAYLGATNSKRTGYPLLDGGGRGGTPVTDPVEGDDFAWADYAPHRFGGPIHIVNITLNQTQQSRSALVYRDRKGMNFALTPAGLSAGEMHWAWSAPLEESRGLLQRLFRKASPRHRELLPLTDDAETALPEPRKLGEWMAVSGAAFTTGSGARTSVGQCLLLGLAGVRLGYWWNSGLPERAKTRFVPAKLEVLLSEFLARFGGPDRKLWYLSDGGHFENTGVYELLKRRLPLIIVSDNGCDGNYDFDDLANLVRKARTDLATGIEFWKTEKIRERFGDVPHIFGRLEDIQPRKDAPAAKSFIADRFGTAQAAIASVRYPGEAEPSGLLVLLKPSLTGSEPVDVLQYASSHKSFPQEPTSDQFFDEAQWESYRMLGEHITHQAIKAAIGARLSPALVG